MTATSALTRNGLVGALAQEIGALIRREQLRPGQRLPTVKALAERFDVAVPTLREAIRRLEALGMVEIRHGAGIFVRAEQPRLMFSRPDFGAIDAQVVLDLLDARRLIEPYLAEHAALAASPDQLARLTDLLAQAERHLGDDDRALRKANMSFHVEVARCSGNVVLTQVMESLVELYASEQSAMLVLANAREQDHREHVAILAAIRAGDGPKAKSLMRRHLESAKRLMSARLAEASHAHKVGWLDPSSRPVPAAAKPLALEGEW